MTSLIYIHMQMQIVELAYKGKAKEHRVHELMDSNGSLTHQILALKSANNLGQELLEKDEGLQFMGHDNILTYSGPAAARLPEPALEKARMKAESPLWGWLTSLTPREAEAGNR